MSAAAGMEAAEAFPSSCPHLLPPAGGLGLACCPLQQVRRALPFPSLPCGQSAGGSSWDKELALSSAGKSQGFFFKPHLPPHAPCPTSACRQEGKWWPLELLCV